MNNMFKIMLSSINDVKQFVNAANDQPCDIDIVSGRYVIDAKSIMGIFSIDLAKAITVEVHGTQGDVENFREAVKDYIVEEE